MHNRHSTNLCSLRLDPGWPRMLTLVVGLLLLSAAACAQTAPDRQPRVVRDGRPMLLQDGQPVTSIYCDRNYRPNWHKRNQAFARIGVDTFELTLRGDQQSDFYTTAFWLGEGQYNDNESSRDDENALLDQARHILEVNPDAHFIIDFFTKPPIAFAKANPEQMQTGEDGKRYRSGSFASQRWIDGQAEMIRRLVNHIDNSEIADRVVGYTIIAQDEGGTLLAVGNELFDQSQVMQDRFAEYLREKYGNDAALREAWHDDEASLDAANVPTMKRYRADREQWLSFTTREQTQRYRDYFFLQRDLLHNRLGRFAQVIHDTADRPVVVTLDALKQPMAGWLIADAFDAAGRGGDQPDYLLAAGSFDVARTLDLPQIDGLMTPADYTARSMGYGFWTEGLSGSLVIRGKLAMPEDDSRTWIKNRFDHEQGAFRNPAEARVGLRRNLAAAATRGQLPHWANVSIGYFDSPEMMKIMEPLIPLREKLFTAPLGHTRDAIAVILDDTSHLYTDFTSGFLQLAVVQQRISELAQIGLPSRVYLLSDLEREDMPRYKAYLFPNLLKLNEQRIELIREKVLRDGQLAIFGPATGITDGQTLTAEPASELLGMKLNLVKKKLARRVMVHAGAHPAVEHVPAPLAYGDSYPYGPLLVPPLELPDGVEELGKGNFYWRNNSAGLVLRETGQGAAGNGTPGARDADDAAVVFSAAAPIPASVLRSLALYAGVNPWSELGDVVHTDGRLLSVHSVRPGERTITLPQRSNVSDYETGEPIARDAREFEITLDSPGIELMEITPSEGSE